MRGCSKNPNRRLPDMTKEERAAEAKARKDTRAAEAKARKSTRSAEAQARRDAAKDVREARAVADGMAHTPAEAKARRDKRAAEAKARRDDIDKHGPGPRVPTAREYDAYAKGERAAGREPVSVAAFRSRASVRGISLSGTPRAQVIGRMLAAGILEAGQPVSWGELSRVMDIAENNSHGAPARAELEAEWAARAYRRRNDGGGDLSLEGNKDTRADSDFSARPVPPAGETPLQSVFKARRDPSSSDPLRT